MEAEARRTVKGEARALLDRLVSRQGYRLMPASILLDWQLRGGQKGHAPGTLPEAAASYLRPENPRLRELTARYASADDSVTTPTVWTDGYVSAEDLQYFRGDNAYVWQVRNVSEINYALMTYYLRTVDTRGFLDRLEEDGAFGAFTFEVAGRLVSRDLLDSVAELSFLDRHLGIASRRNLTVLDVGAGYGRLAHRAVTALDGISHYYCVDAVAVSTFLSEYYVQFRAVNDRATVVPLDELESRLAGERIDLAINIHSFSECSVAAIDWWIRKLRSLGVRHLMIAPNAVRAGGAELRTNTGEDFLPYVLAGGYRLVVKEPKYADPVVQKNGIYPTYYWLFELSAG